MNVILVDENNKEKGTIDKIEAHKKGKLHRAFSIFVFNDKNELLLQKRADNKYHSSGKWSNTCCSHPLPGKDVEIEAGRRLKEEMGFNCELENKFEFIYLAELENKMIEHEYDFIFFGTYNKDPDPDPKEVSDWKWISLEKLKKEMLESPEKYTPWLRIIMQKFIFSQL